MSLPPSEQPEHEEARRLAGKLLTGNERELARASWANGVVADPNIPKWGNLVLEAYDAAAALIASLEAQLLKAEQELAEEARRLAGLLEEADAKLEDKTRLAENLKRALSKAEQERDYEREVAQMNARSAEGFRDRARAAERELERLREAICAKAHHFPPDAVGGDSCYCGKAAW